MSRKRSNRRSGRSPKALEVLLQSIESAADSKQPGRELGVIWSTWSDDDPNWNVSAAPYQSLSRHLLKLELTGMADEVACAGIDLLERFAGRRRQSRAASVDLRQIRALALTRNGSPEQANQIARQLQREGCNDEETLGILASTFKVIGLASDGRQRRRLLRKSLAHYQEAYQGEPTHYWTGINVAALLTLLGDRKQGMAIARQVDRQCRVLRRKLSRNKSYWLLATIGEAALIMGDNEAAERSYRSAHAVNRTAYGELNSTRWQLRLLLTQFGLDEQFVNQWLPIPKIVVFAGHMIDSPTRPKTRFPSEAAGEVKRTIGAWLREENALLGYSSAACGGDILFQEAVRECEGEPHVVLPFDADDFVEQSVAFAGSNWSRRFRKVLDSAAGVVFASGKKMEFGTVSYEYANLLLNGIARVRACVRAS